MMHDELSALKRWTIACCAALVLCTPEAHAQLPDSLWASIFHKPGVGGQVYATLQVGDLMYVGGKFNNMVDGSNLRHFAIYDLTNKCWIDPGGDMFATSSTEIRAIALDPTDSSIIIGGYFTQIAGNSGIQHVARYDGASFTTLSGTADGFDRTIHDIIATDSAIYLGGFFTAAGGLAVSGVARWRPGVGWDDLLGGVRKNGSSDARVYALAMPLASLYVAGWFDSAGTQATANIAQFAGTTWLPIGDGIDNGEVYALHVRNPPGPGLDFAVGGSFQNVGYNQAASFIALYSFSSGRWLAFPNTTFDNRVRAITYNNGYFAGGDFDVRGADTVRHLAFYQSATERWVEIGPPDATVHHLDNVQGDLVVGGEFVAIDSQIVGGISRTNLVDGWTTYGMGANSTGFNKDIRSVAVDTAGVVYVGGTFERMGNAYASGLAVWDGDTWSSFADQPDGSIECVTFIDDTLYVGGQFQMLGNDAIRSIAKWDGQNWIALGSGLNGTVVDIVQGSDGNIYAAGDIVNPNPLVPGAFARWNDTSWQFLLSPQADQFTNVGGVWDLLATSLGGIYFGGSFGFEGRDGGGSPTLFSPNIGIFDVFGDSCMALYRPDSGRTVPTVRTMVIDVDGSLLVGGHEAALYRDAGQFWQRFALCFEPRSMAPSNEGLFIGGLNRNVTGCIPVIRRIGVAYENLGGGVGQFDKPEVMAMAVDGQKLWVVGDFERAGVKAASNISHWTLEEPPDTSTTDKKLVVRAYNSLVLFAQSFRLYKVFNDRPNYTQVSIGTVFSDGLGQIDLSGFLKDGSLEIGDTLRLARVVHTEPSKKHPSLNQYSIELDNMVLDTLGDVSYQLVLDTSAVQLVTLDHTTLAFNLVVSLEWDAAIPFLQNTQTCFRRCANNLYDVSDGQMRLDTMYIYDDREAWDYADIRIRANNTEWPHVEGGGGIARKAGKPSRPVLMPRMHMGNSDWNRDSSHINHPLDISRPSSYRTMVHEFGHYGLTLKDEYTSRLFQDKFVHCASVPNYGFMDGSYISDGVYSSEMSTANRYADESCQNTWQWQQYRQSCWETIEAAYEGTYGGVPIPIYRPNERALPSGLDYLPGPFDSTTNVPNNVSYDAGARVIFPVSPTTPGATDLEVVFTYANQAPASALPAIHVWSIDLSTVTETYQGLTANSGKIWALGVAPAGAIRASGFYEDFTVNPLAAAATAPPRKWLYGEADVGGADSLHMVLEQVQGEYNLVSAVEPTPGGLQYTMFTSGPFAVAPVLVHRVAGVTTDSATFTPTASGYEATVNDSLNDEGEFQIETQDDSGATFIFPLRYTTSTPDSSGTHEAMGPDGASILNLDSSASTLSHILLSSTSYPVLRTGLDPLAVQAGDVHSVGFQPGAALPGEHSLTLRYADSDFAAGTGLFGEETQLRVFKWSESLLEWELAGGSVDTAFNEVSVPISEPGVFALFSTDVSTGIGDDPTGSVLPNRFELYPNHPNPFNPNTSIRYSLAAPSHVTLTVFNILGQHVTTVVDAQQAAGDYEITWDGTSKSGSQVASGVYFYRLSTDQYQQTRKMLLLR